MRQQRQVICVFIGLLLSVISSFASNTCSNCRREVDELLTIRSVAGEKKMVCLRCYLLVPRCTICRLPLQKTDFHRLTDGRVVCGEDFRAGIFGQGDADEVAREAGRELERAFYRFSMKFPSTNVTVQLVDADRLAELAHVQYDPRYPIVQGLTRAKFFDSSGHEIKATEIDKKGIKPARAQYNVYLLAGMPRARLIAVCAHELGHTWLFENLDLQREFNLEGKTREGFCELLAHQLMGAMNQGFEQAVIEANLYTFGQASLLIDVEKEFGFNRVLQWMKRGQDLNISSDNLDRLQILNGGDESAAAPAPSSFGGFVNLKPTKIPDTLLLKGIMGSGARKLALINNQTFSASESAKVKIGTTNVLVEVVEIRDRSVLIRTNKSTQTAELFLQ